MARPETRTARYRFYDAEGVPLYFGVAVDPERRWPGHQRTDWWGQVDQRRTRLDWYDTWELAHEAEVAAIAAERPRHNRAHSTPDPSVGPAFTSEQVRKDFSRVMGTVRFGKAHARITQNGSPAAVVVPLDWYLAQPGHRDIPPLPPKKRA